MEPQGAEVLPQPGERFSHPPAPAGHRDSSSKAYTPHSRKGYSFNEKKRKDLFTDTFCKVCGAVLMFESQRISHYESKKHAQKVRFYFLTHHEKEPEEPPAKKTKTDHVSFQVDGKEVSDENKHCSLCNMVFSSAVVAQSHYVGKIHAKKLKQAPAEHARSCSPIVQVPSQITEKETAGEHVVAAVPSNPPEPPSEKPSQQDVNMDLPSSSDNAIDINDANKYCKLCSAHFSNPLMAKQHYHGKRHTRNEARKRMMAEMGEAVPSDSITGVGVGTFICPICSITFTSIEMYQSHMQGNKHQIKENFVVKLMNNSKKTYDNFQDELADYIKVQKARGLEPKTTLRKTEQCYESCEYEEEEEQEEEEQHAPPEGSTFPRRAPFEHSHSFSEHCSRMARNRSPYRSPAQRNYLRGRYPQKSQYRLKSYPKQQHMQASSLKEKVSGPSSVDSSEDLRHVSSDDSSDSYRKERKQKRKHRKEKRHRGEELRKDEEHVEKNKKSIEDIDSEKDNLHLKNEKEDMDTTNEENVKHRKEKKSKAEPPADKESKKHKRGKKKKDLDPRTEEEKLWDESILGF